MLRNILYYHNMQYQVYPRSQTGENGQNLFSWIINEIEFSREKRPCNFPILCLWVEGDEILILLYYEPFVKPSLVVQSKNKVEMFLEIT